jgi:hypothetical protein
VAATPRRSTGSGRYLGAAGLILFVLVSVSFLLRGGTGGGGVTPGQPLPQFALPLVSGDVKGEADIATRPDQGAAGRHPACSVRGPGILNVCELYERSPLVLALFIEVGDCADVLHDMQALAPSFPGVRFAAVAITGDRARLRSFLASHGLTLPVGIDSGDDVLGQLYRVVTCPQLTFVYPGGRVQGKQLDARPSRAALRARVAALVAASYAAGWRGTGAAAR